MGAKGGYEEQTAIQRTKARPEGPRTGPAYLMVITGELVGTVFELPLGKTLIGRAEVAPVQLPDDGVSRRHAKIVRESDGSAKLVDLDSTNGTYINGRRIHAEGLREGDRIRIGQAATLDFRYSYHEASLIGIPVREHVDARVPVKSQKLGSIQSGYENIVGALDDLSKVYTKQEQHDEAVSTYRRTLQIRELKFGKDHLAVASILDALGAALQDSGEQEEALEHHERALAIFQAQVRPPRETGHVLAHMGRCLLAQERGDAALDHLERAYAMLRSHGASSAELSHLRFGMAKALLFVSRDRERMLELARMARDAFAAGGASTRVPYEEAQRWLQEHG